MNQLNPVIDLLVKSLLLPVLVSCAVTYLANKWYHVLHQGEHRAYVRSHSVQLFKEEISGADLQESTLDGSCYLLLVSPREEEAGGGYDSKLKKLSTGEVDKEKLYMRLEFKNVGSFDALVTHINLIYGDNCCPKRLTDKGGRRIQTNAILEWYVDKKDCPTHVHLDYPDYWLVFKNVSGEQSRLLAPNVVSKKRRKKGK